MSDWIRFGQKIVGATSSQSLGLSGAMSGNGMRIATSSSGFCRVYSYIEGNWTQLGADFGGAWASPLPTRPMALNFSGDRIIVGKPSYNAGTAGTGYDFGGSLQVYIYNGNSWEEYGQEISWGQSQNSGFGRAVAINASGNVIATGVPNAETGQSSTGLVKIFKWDGANWALEKDIQVAGDDVSLNAAGDRLAASSDTYTRVFDKNTNNWGAIGQSLISSSARVHLSADGARCAIAGTADVRVVEFLNEAWMQLGFVIPAANARASLNSTGDRVMVREYTKASVYFFNGAAWNKISQDFDGVGGSFGVAINSDGDRIAVAAPDWDVSGDDFIAVNAGSIETYFSPPPVAPPVITIPASSLTYPVNQNFTYQLAATNTPTSWSLNSGQALPPGLTLNQGTGEISGAISQLGTWQVAFLASNAGGTSSPGAITFIAYNSGSNPGSGVPQGNNPVISKAQGVVAYGVGQNFIFQLTASGNPRAWRLGAGQSLPPGVVFNPISGTLSGAGVAPGVWGLTFIATNNNGDSAPQTFTIGIYDVGGSREFSKKALINLKTLAVTFEDPASEIKGANNAVIAAAAAGQVRYGDDIIFKLAFTDGTGAGQGASLIYNEVAARVVMARFSMKGNETEAAFFVTPPPAFKKSAEYLAGVYSTNYYLSAKIAGTALQSYLGDFESDSGTFANALCEFELEFERPAAASGPLTTRVTTQPFLLRVSRDLIS
jgi:hypothetical protein